MTKPISEWTDAELGLVEEYGLSHGEGASLAAEVLRLRTEREDLVLGTAEAVVIDYQATIVRLGAELAAARAEAADNLADYEDLRDSKGRFARHCKDIEETA